jgi:hypothetical protein
VVDNRQWAACCGARLVLLSFYLLLFPPSFLPLWVGGSFLLLLTNPFIEWRWGDWTCHCRRAVTWQQQQLYVYMLYKGKLGICYGAVGGMSELLWLMGNMHEVKMKGEGDQWHRIDWIKFTMGTQSSLSLLKHEIYEVEIWEILRQNYILHDILAIHCYQFFPLIEPNPIQSFIISRPLPIGKVPHCPFNHPPPLTYLH